MIKWILPFILVTIGLEGSQALATSSHMENFKIHQCRENICMRATGSKSFMSRDGAFLAAGNIDMELRTGTASAKRYHCASFRYEVKSQFLVCDNREGKGPTFTLDSNLHYRSY